MVGTLIPRLEEKIASLGLGRLLPPNQQGEVWLPNPSIMTSEMMDMSSQDR